MAGPIKLETSKFFVPIFTDSAGKVNESKKHSGFIERAMRISIELLH